MLLGIETRSVITWWITRKRVKDNIQLQRLFTILMGGNQLKKYERNDHRYVGSPGAATLDISKKGSKHVVDIECSGYKEDDMSAI